MYLHCDHIYHSHRTYTACPCSWRRDPSERHCDVARSDLFASVMMRDLLGGDDDERGKHADLE